MSLFTVLRAWWQPPTASPAPPPQALRAAVQLLGPAAAGDAGLARQLAPAVSRAIDYCAGLVEQVPGLVDIDRQAFSSDPLVHALFASPNDIDSMLGRSLHLRDFLGSGPDADAKHLFSLLAMRRHEKSTLGVALDGDTLRNDVPQTLLYFSDHTLVDLGSDLDATRARLRLSAFESLLACFADHLKAVRDERDRLRGDRALESTHIAVLRGKNLGHEVAVHTRRIDALDARLQDIAGRLSPAALAHALADFLAAPEASLRLEPVQVCVDRAGVIRNGEAAALGQAEAIGFPELVARDRRRHVVVLARIRREEAERAVAAARAEQARFILI